MAALIGLLSPGTYRIHGSLEVWTVSMADTDSFDLLFGNRFLSQVLFEDLRENFANKETEFKTKRCGGSLP